MKGTKVRKRISQRAAYGLKKKVRDLESELSNLKRQVYWPDGALPYWHKIAVATLPDRLSGALMAAETLRYGILAKPYPSGEVAFFASREPRQ